MKFRSGELHSDKRRAGVMFTVSAISLFVLLTLPAITLAGGDDAGAALMHHVTDNHQWQPLPFFKAVELHDIVIGPVTVPFTQHVLMLWINAVILTVLLIGAFGKKRLLPSRLGSMLEPIVFFVRDALVYPTMGAATGEKWLPFFTTLFFFILSANLLGMIPLFGTVTGNISITGALAVMVFFAIIISGMRKNGAIGFFMNMIPEGIPFPISVFLLIIEIPGLIIRSSVLAIRLFANMIAGHFVIYSLLILIFIIHPLVGTVSIPMALFISLLEVLVAIIQAVVFTMLSAIFISMAQSRH